jgi:hypothetical protein
MSPDDTFIADRRWATPLQSLKGPWLEPHELKPGDAVCFSGQAPVSTSIRFFDDCRYDHVALIAEPDPDATLNPDYCGVWVIDIGFYGVRHYPIEEYDDLPDAVIVRRHRNPTWQGPVLERAHELVHQTSSYNWERVLLLIVVSLTRFAPQLKHNAEQWAGKSEADQNETTQEFRNRMGRDPKRFVANLAMLLTVVEQNLAVRGEKRICVDFVHDSFDVSRTGTFDENDDYYGLVIRRRGEPDGLLAWAASADDFLDYLAMGSSPEVADENSIDPDAAVRALYSSAELLPSQVPFLPNKEIEDDELRRVIVVTARTALRLLGWKPQESTPIPPAESGSRAIASYLLDQLLKHRFLLTPFDLAATKSLYDAGHLDVSKIGWTYRVKLRDKRDSG